jgi:hypothetical protein
MPRIIFLSLLFLSFFVKGYGQDSGQKTIVNWDTPVKVLDSTQVPREAIHFDGAGYKAGNILPYFSLKINARVTEFTLVNPVYQMLSDEENHLIPSGTDIPSMAQIETDLQNKRPVSFIYFVPIRRNASGGIEKLLSFEYTFVSAPFVPQAYLPASNPSFLSNARMGSTTSAGSSVLSSGDWYKLAVSSTGILKIDYAFLQQMGINPASIDPRQIKLYGNAIGMLPQANASPRPTDLQENAIFVQGENDGVFNSSDYVLFYAKSPDTWIYNTTLQQFTHTKHLYSDYAYYFLTIGPSNGIRLADEPEVSGPLQTISTFDDYKFYEPEQTNILKSGREWYGDIFDFTLQRNYDFSFPGITPNSTIKVTGRMMANSPATYPSQINTSFTASINGNPLGSISIPGISISPGDNYPSIGAEASNTFSINSNLISSSNLSISLTYNKSGNFSASGYFNFLEINTTRDLQLYGNETAFRSVASTSAGISQFVIKGVNNDLTIWDVTDPMKAKNQLYSFTSLQDSFTVVTDTIKEYIMFTGSSFSAPVFIEKVKNQDLHGINSPNLPDMVIVTVPEFKSAAQALANFRYTNDKLDVIVTTTDEVFNEFSSGAQDVTAIRDFMKMLYDRGTASDSIRYLLLFGDCSYDYKNRVSGNTNFVPVYESRQSLNPLSTYSSDDYFGLLEDSEGNWTEPYTLFEPTDIGIGRLPVKNSFEAYEVVNKIIHYNNSKDCLGKWRNRVTFVSDDMDVNGNSFLSESNGLATDIEVNHKQYNVTKIFMDAYAQVNSPSGETAPTVNESISQEIEKGTFLVNFVGHGSEIQWTQEDILNVNTIGKWENYNKLPFFITATCEFGRYDDPSRVSGGETIILGNQGGGIGVLCSTRPVFSGSNNTLNSAFLDALFAKSNGKMQRLGDIIMQAKTNDVSRFSINNRNYGLLADPSMMLEYPEENIVLTKINTNNISASADTIKALSKVTIQGEVRYGAGSKMTNFNGSVYITVYDKPSTINTFPPLVTTFKSMNNFIYEGIASVKNGDFTIAFVVPKDISYAYDFGKISLYASKNSFASDTLDAAGYYSNIVIGGTSSSVIADNNPPVIRLFMHDTTFVFGGLTNSNTVLIAKISDENGINIAGEGIGHEITASLDNSTNVFVLNEFYSSILDNYQQGMINFPIKEISPGNHSIKLKAWDTYNNSSEAYLEFVVANNEEMAIQNVLNYPNPFSTHTNFHFDHNRAGDDIEVLVSIYTVSGKLIKTLDNRFYGSGSHISDINWDGRDDFGDNIGKGVYVYKVDIRSLRDGSNNFKYQKLVILN